MKIALTGATGNMGREALLELSKLQNIDKIKILVSPTSAKKAEMVINRCGKNKNKIEIVFGNITSLTSCKELVKDVSYCIHLAAVIPPRADKHPELAVSCNENGTKNLIIAIEECNTQPKFIHTSTVALYGNRNYKCAFANTGDPLLVSPLDVYSVTKLRAEFAVLESNLQNWVILRQSAMLHTNMLKDNMNDGLMFHTCFNSPLEWVTAHDSGVLIANIIDKDSKEDLSKCFWKKIFNIGANGRNQITGYCTLNDGFKIIGGATKNFFKPYYNATRNFHGVWFYDGSELDNLFHYVSQDVKDYWKQISKKFWYYKFGKIIPKKLISKFAIQKLFKDDNSPAYWYSQNDIPKLTAFFGGKENYENLPKDWNNFNLLAENKTPEGETIDFSKLTNKKNAKLIDYGFDYFKQDSEITKQDLENVAKMHGGKLLTKTFKTGDVYATVSWQDQDGNEFSAKPFTVLRAGHWLNPCYTSFSWEFDRLSKTDKIYSQIWHTSHNKDENYVYFLDNNFNAQIRTDK